MFKVKRPTEKGLLIASIGFFGQAAFQLLSLYNMSFVCYLDITSFLVVIGMILIYVGRFEFSEKHTKFARIALITFIAVHGAVFVLNIAGVTSSMGPLGSEVIRFAQNTSIFIANFLVIFNLAEDKKTKILGVGLALGIITAGAFSFMSLPLTSEDHETDEKLIDILGDDEYAELMIKPAALEEYEDEREELLLNITQTKSGLNSSFANWSYHPGMSAGTVDILNVSIYNLKESFGKIEALIDEKQDDLAKAGSEAERENIQADIAQLREDLVTGHALLNESARKRDWIMNNTEDARDTGVVIDLLEKRNDNEEQRREYQIITLPPVLIFGFVYYVTYKRIKQQLDGEEAEKAKRVRKEEEEDEDEDGTALIGRPGDKAEKGDKGAKKSAPKRARKKPKDDVEIMDLDEIRKKYSK